VVDRIRDVDIPLCVDRCRRRDVELGANRRAVQVTGAAIATDGADGLLLRRGTESQHRQWRDSPEIKPK